MLYSSIRVQVWVLNLNFFLVTILLSKHDQNHKFTEEFYFHNISHICRPQDDLVPSPRVIKAQDWFGSKIESLTSESKTQDQAKSVSLIDWYLIDLWWHCSSPSFESWTFRASHLYLWRREIVLPCMWSRKMSRNSQIMILRLVPNKADNFFPLHQK